MLVLGLSEGERNLTQFRDYELQKNYVIFI